MHGVVMLKGGWQLAHDGQRIAAIHLSDVSRLNVFTKLSAMPLDCGLLIAVVRGTRLIC